MTFNEWLDDLEENVIQGEYGYEPDEFTVFPELWRPAFEEGLTALIASIAAFAIGGLAIAAMLFASDCTKDRPCVAQKTSYLP